MNTLGNFTDRLEAASIEYQEYFLEFAARDFNRLKQWEELEELLSNFEYLQTKLGRYGIDALISDYDYLKDSELSLVQDALKLSAPALRRDPPQLYTQLFGRLRYGGGPKINKLLARTPPFPWLRDHSGVLLPAIGAVVQNVMGDAKSTISFTDDAKHAISVAPGPDGKNDSPHLIRIWNLATSEPLSFLFKSSDPVQDIVASPDGKKVILLQESGLLTVLNQYSAAEVTLNFRNAAVVRFAENCERVYVGYKYGNIEIWDLKSGKMICQPGSHRRVTSLVGSTSGDTLVSGSENGTLTIWRGQWHSPLTFRAHEGEVEALAIGISGRWIVSASRDGTVRGWEAAHGTALFTAHGYKCSGTSYAAKTLLLRESSEGLLVFSTGSDYALKVWKWTQTSDGATEKTVAPLVHIFSGHQGTITSVAANPDGERIISASEDGTLKEWSLTNGKLIRTLRAHTGRVYAVRITPDGSRAVSAATDNTVKVWSLKRGGGDIAEQGSPVTDIAIANAGRRAIGISLDESIRVLSLFNYKRLFSLAEQPFGKSYRPERQHSSQRVAITRDGAKAVSLSATGDLCAWRTMGRESTFPSSDIGVLHHFRNRFPFRLRRKWSFNVDFALTSDGSAVLSSTVDGAVHFWDFETGAIRRSFYRGESRLCTMSAFLGRCVDPLNGCLGTIVGLACVVVTFYKFGWEALWWFLPGVAAFVFLTEFIGKYDPANRRKQLILKTNDKQAIVISSTGLVETWDLSTGSLLRKTDYSKIIKDKFSLGGVRASPGGRWFATTAGFKRHDDWTLESGQSVISVWNAQTGTLHRELRMPGHVRWYCFTDDEAHLVSVSYSDVTIWHLDSARIIRKLEGEYFSPDITPDGSRLVAMSAAAVHELIVLDVPTGSIARFGADVKLSIVKLTEDGRTVVVGDESGRIFFLDAEAM